MKSLLALLLLACTVRGQVSGTDLLDKILAKNVRQERVDYLVIQRDHWKDLVKCLDAFSKVDRSKLSKDDQLAFSINLYNASMIRAVIEHLSTTWTPEFQKFAVFKEKRVRLGKQRISLDTLEHEIIRKTFKEPRVHAALVCGAISCPPLLPRAYRGADLEKTLESNMRRFVNDPRRNRVDVAQKRLRLSKIFDWFAADFGGSKRLAAYVDRYHESALREFRVSHLPYSWKLNIAPPASGEWVSVTAAGVAAVPSGSILSVVKRTGDRVTVRAPFPGQETLELSARDVTSYP